MRQAKGYKIFRHGWLPHLPDRRDHICVAPVERLAGVSTHVDLRGRCLPVYDRIEVGGCTADAIAGVIESDRLMQKSLDFTLPRLFIDCYNEGAVEHTIDTGSGAQIGDGLKSVARRGDCHEPEGPYVIAEFKIKPPKQGYTDALKYRGGTGQRLSPVFKQLKGCLAPGNGFLFDFTVYESFESVSVTKIRHALLRRPGERAFGGLVVVGVGYLDAWQWLMVSNSRGSRWGISGYLTFPYTELTDENIASDFWTIRNVP